MTVCDLCIILSFEQKVVLLMHCLCTTTQKIYETPTHPATENIKHRFFFFKMSLSQTKMGTDQNLKMCLQKIIVSSVATFFRKMCGFEVFCDSVRNATNNIVSYCITPMTMTQNLNHDFKKNVLHTSLHMRISSFF